jgi:uncharacterized protein GlcG (DUF336 family)
MAQPRGEISAPVADARVQDSRLAERAVSAAQARARGVGTPITVTVVDDDGQCALAGAAAV